jgi:hypothetical protein
MGFIISKQLKWNNPSSNHNMSNQSKEQRFQRFKIQLAAPMLEWFDDTLFQSAHNILTRQGKQCTKRALSVSFHKLSFCRAKASTTATPHTQSINGYFISYLKKFFVKISHNHHQSQQQKRMACTQIEENLDSSVWERLELRFNCEVGHRCRASLWCPRPTSPNLAQPRPTRPATARLAGSAWNLSRIWLDAIFTFLTLISRDSIIYFIILWYSLARVSSILAICGKRAWKKSHSEYFFYCYCIDQSIGLFRLFLVVFSLLSISLYLIFLLSNLTLSVLKLRVFFSCRSCWNFFFPKRVLVSLFLFSTTSHICV